jgi:hypothetical protein
VVFNLGYAYPGNTQRHIRGDGKTYHGLWNTQRHIRGDGKTYHGLCKIEKQNHYVINVIYFRYFRCRMPSSGTLRHVALVRTDVSEEGITINRVKRIGEIGTMLAVTSNRRTL